ncbi:sigma-70 family rna polymerase sigma factor : RNA polymerase sigma factor, sigma-70 family OS=Singulisphaera acidiphila (strain ATCC BAA-1392 / DSM 18658 / VKM B-2454 / MOB10) GN=Sinac_6419 PE=4 SV=1: Sigma70_r2: Sigma70_r4_2 [Gemmata massiliana]|uniref:ECF RNA polymerase sigma factor SigE n=1 Tax=Gemmata massiliana TaxID=1210884 RepID=A0A6P2D865_9BACT|nr:sigma-70 family RNA polymerase sigma factor [Gemmata massiliana]VTR97047.1 sigma-70 family rna polymerase sigma factor : RNA polymerase sigma factor, sigma-70 family OS=Singulisphaera acidiphila (strain ATCC BAA-1392 / DSM 18658 / VKM B-2454 / MOB10) GN=Sinac_6419 PE=4 SV=1: Sigma70_r2: Sigma70_r4_2 [Gemmata massiliana]
MTNSRHGQLGRRLREIVADDARSDGQLLESYVHCHDAASFATLVRRHGPMVWGVCRRLLGDHHDAEDAFQATFLVLVGRPDAVVPRSRVAGWLYGVAYKIALKARGRTCRRRTRERLGLELPEPVAPVETDWSDLRPVLDRELSRLPERYRDAVLLCDVAGETYADAARRLGCPEGTLAARLSRGRALLAARLSRRGIALTVSALAAALPVAAEAGVPPSRVRSRTVDIAELVMSGGAAPTRVAALAHVGLKALVLSGYRSAVAGVFLLAALVGGATADPPAPARSPLPAAPAPRPVTPREGLILLTSFAADDAVELFKPDGTPARRPSVGELSGLWRPQYSPDGNRLAVAAIAATPQGSGPWSRNDLYILNLDSKNGPGEPLVADARCLSFAWHPDGTKLFVSHLPSDKANDSIDPDKVAPVRTWMFDLKTGKKTPLEVPEGHNVVDVSPDGKRLLTVTTTLKGIYPGQTYLVPIGAPKARLLTEARFSGLRFSPDGKSVLGLRIELKDRNPPELTLAVLAVADGSEQVVELPKNATGVYHACWSPDGRRVAFHWLEEVPLDPNAPPPVGDARGYAGRVTIADRDGSNPKTILISDGKRTISGLDWK